MVFFSTAAGPGYSFKNNLQGIVFTESVSAGSCHRQGEAEDEKDDFACFQHFLCWFLSFLSKEREESELQFRVVGCIYQPGAP